MKVVLVLDCCRDYVSFKADISTVKVEGELLICYAAKKGGFAEAPAEGGTSKFTYDLISMIKSL